MFFGVLLDFLRIVSVFVVVIFLVSYIGYASACVNGWQKKGQSVPIKLRQHGKEQRDEPSRANHRLRKSDIRDARVLAKQFVSRGHRNASTVHI